MGVPQVLKAMHGFDQDDRKLGDEEEEEEEDIQLHRSDASKQSHHVIHLNDVETRSPSLSVTSAPLLIEKWTKSAVFVDAFLRLDLGC